MADVTGFMVGRAAEQAGIAKAGAKMITAMASANVPKYTIMGASTVQVTWCVAACSTRPQVCLADRPRGHHGSGSGRHGDGILVRKQINKTEGKEWDARGRRGVQAPVRKIYEDFQPAANFSSNLWVDGIIDPVETRDAMGLLLDLASRTAAKPTPFGVRLPFLTRTPAMQRIHTVLMTHFAAGVGHA